MNSVKEIQQQNKIYIYKGCFSIETNNSFIKFTSETNEKCDFDNVITIEIKYDDNSKDFNPSFVKWYGGFSSTYKLFNHFCKSK